MTSLPSAILTGPLPKIRISIDPGWAYFDVWPSPINQKFIEVVNFSYEEGIQESQGVAYTSDTVAGRAEPYVTYEHTDAMIYTIPFVLHADGDDGERDITKVIRNEVIGPLNFLNSLKQPFRPIRNVAFVHGPPPVLVTMGRFLQIRGVVTDFSPGPKGVFDSLTLQPHQVDCTLTVQVVRTKIPDNYPSNRVFT